MISVSDGKICMSESREANCWSTLRAWSASTNFSLKTFVTICSVGGGCSPFSRYVGIPARADCFFSETFQYFPTW